MKVWVSVVKTESSDTYVFLHKTKKTYEEIIRLVWKSECDNEEEWDWYLNTTSVYFYEKDILE